MDAGRGELVRLKDGFGWWRLKIFQKQTVADVGQKLTISIARALVKIILIANMGLNKMNTQTLYVTVIRVY